MELYLLISSSIDLFDNIFLENDSKVCWWIKFNEFFCCCDVFIIGLFKKRWVEVSVCIKKGYIVKVKNLVVVGFEVIVLGDVGYFWEVFRNLGIVEKEFGIVEELFEE